MSAEDRLLSRPRPPSQRTLLIGSDFSGPIPFFGLEFAKARDGWHPLSHVALRIGIGAKRTAVVFGVSGMVRFLRNVGFHSTPRGCTMRTVGTLEDLERALRAKRNELARQIEDELEFPHTVTANCGALTTSRVVITNLRGSGCSPSWIQICKSTCGARNARWSQRTPSTTDLPTTNAVVTSCIRMS